MGIYNISGGAVESGHFPALSMFESVGVIGDSFASGAVYATGELVDHYNVSWPQVINRSFGVKVANYTKGGFSAQKWLNNTKYGLARLNAEKPHGLYVIALGINDAQTLGTAKLGTIADVDSDSTDSFYSYYGRVVRAVREHAPSAIVLLSTLARWGGAYDQYSDAVKVIGAHYSLAVIDLSESAFFKSAFFAGNQLRNHPTAVNYSAMAKEYTNLIEKTLEENAALYSGFIGGQIISGDAKNYVTPEQFGAVGDGFTDDSDAIQAALNNAGCVIFGTGKSYKVTKTLRIKDSTLIDLAGSTIISTNKHLMFNFQTADVFLGYDGNGNITIRDGTIIGGALSFAHGKNIRLENVIFKNSLNDHFLEIAGCKNYVIENCRFIGMADVQTSVYEYINVDPVTYTAFPWLTNGSAFYDGTKNDGIKVNNCYFSLGDGDYVYGFNAFGVHSVAGQAVKHKNIRLTNNEVLGFTGCGFRINDMENVFIANNDINVESDGIRVGDVGQSTDVLIKGNVIVASGEAVTKANSSTVFQSDDNDINPTFS